MATANEKDLVHDYPLPFQRLKPEVSREDCISELSFVVFIRLAASEDGGQVLFFLNIIDDFGMLIYKRGASILRIIPIPSVGQKKGPQRATTRWGRDAH